MEEILENIKEAMDKFTKEAEEFIDKMKGETKDEK